MARLQNSGSRSDVDDADVAGPAGDVEPPDGFGVEPAGFGVENDDVEAGVGVVLAMVLGLGGELHLPNPAYHTVHMFQLLSARASGDWSYGDVRPGKSRA